MYPLIKSLQIELACEYFLQDAPEEDRILLHCCLEMVKFSMANTLIQFNGAYYEYSGNVDVNNKGLTIGGFESAFFADLVAAWILENTEEHMTDVMFDSVYRDDGILVFNKKNTANEIVSWRNNFQASVNRLTQSEHLQLSVDIWDPDAPAGSASSDPNFVKICTDNVFPYFDMELYWCDNGLKFKVHLKPNQKLKYLRKEAVTQAPASNPSRVE
jgi:hypothetical protein